MRTVKENTTYAGLSELRTHADEIISVLRDKPVVLEKRHKPVAVLVPIAQYERTEALMEQIEDVVLGHLAQERLKHTKSTDWIPLEQALRRVGLKR